MAFSFVRSLVKHTRSLRRPEDPSGRTVPVGLVLRRAQNLHKLLPERMPRFQPGAKPVPGTDLVIEELLGVGGFRRKSALAVG